MRKALRNYRTAMPKHSPHPMLDRIINWLRKVKNVDRSDELAAIIRRSGFDNLSDETAVKLLKKQFESVFQRLTRVRPNIEQGDGHPPNGNFEGGLTPSRLLYGEDYPEINRTVVNFLSLKWLLEGNYEAFTAYQPKPVRLSQGTFDNFRNMARKILVDGDRILALIVSLILGDVGKDPDLVKEIARLKKSEMNHDEVLGKAIQLNLFNQPLEVLPKGLRDDVILGVNVGAKLNIPQLMQGENVPGSLQSVLMLQGRSQAFELKYLEIMFDVSGAGGHVDARGAIRMIEPVCQSFLLAYPVLQKVITKQCTVQDAYNQVLQNRGAILAEKGFRKLLPNNPRDRAFLRLCAMGRVADEPIARLFDRAFENLPDQTRQELIDGLNVNGFNDGEAVILYYMPGLFAEAFRVTRNTPEAKQVEVIQSLMFFMARTYNGSKPGVGYGIQIIERDVSPATEIVRSEGFKKDPTVLNTFYLPQSLMSC